MLFFSTCFFALCLIQTLAAYEEWENHFDHYTYLDGNDLYRFYWTILEDSKQIEIGLEVNTLGWVGFGLSATGQMTNADIVLGWIDTNGTSVTLQNRYTLNQRIEPTLFEDQSNIQLLKGWQTTNKTYLHFTRLLYPCQENTVQVPQGTARIIFAWNNNKPDPNPSYHGNNRGNQAINLLIGETAVVPMPENVETFDINVVNYSLASDDTTYYCKLLELPPSPTQINHIIRVDPIINPPENEGIVHHIVLFVCQNHYVNQSHIGREGVCDDWANMGLPSECIAGSILNVWAVGGSNFYFPEHVGVEFGGNASDAVKYVVLQIHYDNPEERSDIVDNSGFKIWYTPTLRENSASMINIGASSNQYGIFVPPGINNIRIDGFCRGQCTSDPGSGIPANGVKAFGNLLHAHQLGRALRIRHIRNGKELPTFDRNEAYDFNYQQLWILPTEVTILPGDEFIMECDYDSSQYDYITFGGESTRQEMCLSMIYVYPKVDLNFCMTSWNETQIDNFWVNAKANGYANGNNVTLGNFPNYYQSLTYDVTVNGALDYYKSILEDKMYNDRQLVCFDGSTNIIHASMTQKPNDFVVYENDNDPGNCNKEKDEDDSFEWQWDEWYAYLLIVVISFGSGVLCTMCLRQICCPQRAYLQQNAKKYPVYSELGKPV